MSEGQHLIIALLLFLIPTFLAIVLKSPYLPGAVFIVGYSLILFLTRKT